MKRLIVGVLVVAVVALSACGDQESAAEVVTPTPASTPAPSVEVTPSQAELSAMAETTYRAFFEEWTKLERQGGADQPTPVLLKYGGGPYLESVMALLREQQQSGTVVQGETVARVTPGPDGQQFEGIDPRLTLRVCEDHSKGTYVRDGVTQKGQIHEGWVYLGWHDDRPKVVGGDTKVVDRCSI